MRGHARATWRFPELVKIRIAFSLQLTRLPLSFPGNPSRYYEGYNNQLGMYSIHQIYRQVALPCSVEVKLFNREGEAENLMSALVWPSSRSPLVPMITPRSLRSRCSIFVRCCRPACWSASIYNQHSAFHHIGRKITNLHYLFQTLLVYNRPFYRPFTPSFLSAFPGRINGPY